MENNREEPIIKPIEEYRPYEIHELFKLDTVRVVEIKGEIDREIDSICIKRRKLGDAILDTEVIISINKEEMKPEKLLTHYKHPNGARCGILIKE